jgi:hypothetical protein
MGGGLSKSRKNSLIMEITLKFQSVDDRLPPLSRDNAPDSIQCIALVNKEVFEEPLYCDENHNWFWWQYHPSEDNYKSYIKTWQEVTHWAPWPVIPSQTEEPPPTVESAVWVDDDLLALY